MACEVRLDPKDIDENICCRNVYSPDLFFHRGAIYICFFSYVCFSWL